MRQLHQLQSVTWRKHSSKCEEEKTFLQRWPVPICSMQAGGSNIKNFLMLPQIWHTARPHKKIIPTRVRMDDVFYAYRHLESATYFQTIISTILFPLFDHHLITPKASLLQIAAETKKTPLLSLTLCQVRASKTTFWQQYFHFTNVFVIFSEETN